MQIHKLYIITIGILSIFVTSCNEVTNTVANNGQDVELLGNNILKFKDQATFDKYVTEGHKIDGFYSLSDIYEEAMNEAESYYDREGGYEEFKAKYSEFYFPEYGDDYSAYLPISNKNAANLVNPKGEVFIGNELVNKRDVRTYSKLQELGWAIPDIYQIETRGSCAKGCVNHLCEVKKNDRKLWINVETKPCPDYACQYMVEVEICFRKKGFLGAWYNYSSETTLYWGTSLSARKTMSGVSSHDHHFPKSIVNGQFVPFKALMWVQFRGFGAVAGDEFFYFEINK